MNGLERLKTIAQTITTAETDRVPAIQQARDDGFTWEQIADALHMSRSGVIKLYNSGQS